MHSLIRITVAALAMVAGLPAMAQVEEPLAPRIEEKGRTYDIQLQFSGYGNTTDHNAPDLRNPAELTPVEEWFGPSSPVLKAYQDNASDIRSSRIVLEIGADGSVIGCTPTEYSRLPLSADVICSEIAKQRFLPALSQDGERITGKYSVSIYVIRRDAAPSDPRRPLIDNRPAEPAMLAALAPQFDLMRFPPDGRWMRKFYRAPVAWQQAPQAGWQDTPPSDAAIGVMIQLKDGVRSCRIIKYPEGAARGGCKFVMTTLNPQWASSASSGEFGVPLWLIEDGDSFRAIGPIENPRAGAQISDVDSQALSVALTNAGVFPRGPAASPLHMVLRSGADGKITVCRVRRTSGSDAGDFDACRIAKSTVTLLTRQDYFGKALERNSVYWNAAAHAE